MASNKETISEFKKDCLNIMGILTNAVDYFSAQPEESSMDSREAFKDYCKKQESGDEQRQLLCDLQEANPDALDRYYDERVQEDEHYMSCDDVDSDYVRCDEITTEWLSYNQGDSFMEECSDDYLSHIEDEDTFVEHVMRHLTNSRARALMKAIVDEYM